MRIEIGGRAGCSVAIEVLSNTGEDWLECQVSVMLAGFSAEYRTSLDLNAFICFHAELSVVYETLAGSATFHPLEEGLMLEVTMTQTGHAIIRGTARQWTPEATLTFEFESDQSYLGPICRELPELFKQVRLRNRSSSTPN